MIQGARQEAFAMQSHRRVWHCEQAREWETALGQTPYGMIWERMKIIIEPSCAVPFAALLNQKAFFKDKKVGIILTGGNVDMGNLPFE